MRLFIIFLYIPFNFSRLQMFPLSFLILAICIFSFFFLVILLKFRQLYRSFQRTNTSVSQIFLIVFAGFGFKKLTSMVVELELENNSSQANFYSKITRFPFTFNFYCLEMSNNISYIENQFACQISLLCRHEGGKTISNSFFNKPDQPLVEKKEIYLSI